MDKNNIINGKYKNHIQLKENQNGVKKEGNPGRWCNH